jgi:predicted HAD superfamily Cof-like phosphohydrolase
MKDLKVLSQVADFHKTFKVPIEAKPVIPSSQRCALRIRLFEEELQELKNAIAANDLVEVADALCDLQYVLTGTALEFGLGDKFCDLFDEVHRSNMSKACKTREEAEQTIAHYRNNLSTDAYHKEVDGMYIIYRAADDKTLKSVNYVAPALKAILGGKQEGDAPSTI